ncbi:hypothetical protein prwr041_12560 [Prevotella herbatica]|uniref:Uncharacterized protein n=1 Tax=Prevotella herbatica TaxID=2801997 RepID=A0ABM7NY88_9BACT|nr:hypothetical protein prwr041_12560 [Prevotella herbatica]
MGRGLKELYIKDEIYKCGQSGATCKFNIAEKFNELLLEMIKELGLIKVGTGIDLDFDYQFISAYKYDFKCSHSGLITQ